jgi:4-hydroxy-tetrahydrodipicolinate reductase
VTRLVISGIRGRMGQALVQLASAADDLRILAGIGRTAADGAAAESLGAPRVVRTQDAAAIVRDADIIIDFSNAAATSGLLQHAGDVLVGKALLVGTTGLTNETARALDQLAGDTAVLSAANFSIGVNLLLALTERVAAVLDADHYDIEIVESHHRGKADAPSGTALAFGRAVAAGRNVDLAQTRRDGRSGAVGERPRGEIGFHAVRGGGVVGEHRVLFLGARERVELVHEATDRTLFAEGALRAARWLAGRAPGRYEMRDVLGIAPP